MTSEEVFQELEKIQAIIRDSHIVYTSGRHGTHYVNKDALYPHTALTSRLCEEIARRFENSGVEIVLAPALGGIILSQWVAHHLSLLLKKEILGVYAEKAPDGESFILKRGYDSLVKGKRVLILEDVLTTGISVKRVVETVRFHGGEVLGVGALCNRGSVKPEDLGGVPRLDSLIQIQLDSWEERDCPLCKKNIPVNIQVGKGREFLSRNPKG